MNNQSDRWKYLDEWPLLFKMDDIFRPFIMERIFRAGPTVDLLGFFPCSFFRETTFLTFYAR